MIKRGFRFSFFIYFVTSPIQAGPILVNVRDFGAVLNGSTDDSSAIQSAIDSLPTSGGIVLIDGPAGIGANGVVVSEKDAVIIRGIGATAGLKSLYVNDQSLRIANMRPTIVLIDQSNDCILENLNIDGNNQRICGVAVWRSNRIIVQNNHIHDILPPAFENRLEWCYAILGFTNHFNIYRQNTINRVPFGIMAGNVPAGFIETHATVENNTITNMLTSDAIHVMQRGARVLNNSIDTTQASAIIVTASPFGVGDDAILGDIIIRGNIIRNALWAGIQSDVVDGYPHTKGVLVEQNIITENNGAGIYANRADDWIIRNNTIYDNGELTRDPGIFIAETENIRVESNSIYNTRQGTERTQSSGINIVSYDYESSQFDPRRVQNIQILNNTIRNHPYDGIHLTNTGRSRIDNVLVRDNNIQDNGSYGIILAPQNILMFSQIRISGNTFQNNLVASIRNDAFSLTNTEITPVNPRSPGLAEVAFLSMDGAESYELQISQDRSFLNQTANMHGNINQFEISLTEWGTYYARVRGWWTQSRGLEASAWSDPISINISDIDGNTIQGGVQFTRFNKVFNPNRSENCYVSFYVKSSRQVSITIYDRRGNEIRKLADSIFDAGAHSVIWDGRNDDQREIAAGAYAIILKTNEELISTKAVILK